jgi:dTMP kinase
MQRAAARRGKSAPDRFEAEDLKFHQDLREAYKQIAADDPQRCVLIDANTNADAVSEQVWKALRDHLFTLPAAAASTA